MASYAKTSTVYGFATDNITDRSIVNFLISHASTMTEWFDLNESQTRYLKSLEINNFSNLTDEESKFLSLFTDYDPAVYKLLDVVESVINDELDINVTYICAEEEDIGTSAIGLSLQFPWSYNFDERKLTKKKFEELLFPYINELGIHNEELTIYSVTALY